MWNNDIFNYGNDLYEELTWFRSEWNGGGRKDTKRITFCWSSTLILWIFLTDERVVQILHRIGRLQLWEGKKMYVMEWKEVEYIFLDALLKWNKWRVAWTGKQNGRLHQLQYFEGPFVGSMFIWFYWNGRKDGFLQKKFCTFRINATGIHSRMIWTAFPCNVFFFIFL